MAYYTAVSVRQAQSKTVYVAMSGGVDSSVAALLLKKQGFTVVGVFMKPWQTPGVRCMWQADRQDALQVAAKLDIPLRTWDFSKEYGRSVTRYMISEYRAGRTPNPDVMCNKHIKFGLFYERALRQGADLIATGHYARKVGKQIAKAKDKNTDQTYFLWAIEPGCVERTLFPIGHLTKPQVRTIAAKVGLVTADKKDSQGVCFVGDLDVKSFLMRHIKGKKGSIIHVDGRILGTHDGAGYYTIGQRHGLDIKDGGGPYYVIRNDVRRNTITVGQEKDLRASKIQISDTNWLGPKPRQNERVQVKVRYRTPAISAIIGRGGYITFIKPVRAIAPGQSAVIYRGQRLAGGGVIVK
jgi:tRNA-specific 2-thiouridylase